MELLVAEVDARRPVRQASRPPISGDDTAAKTAAYMALIELLERLPTDGELLPTPAQGPSQFCQFFDMHCDQQPVQFV